VPPKPTEQPVVLPEGFVYQPGFLSENEEIDLVRVFQSLPFKAYDYRGYTAKRRVARYGVNYDLTTRKAAPLTPIPDFLTAVRCRAAAFAAIPSAGIVQAMVTEYRPGAPIGWHRDSPQFGTIIGISLASLGRMRLKPYRGEGKLVSLMLEPRSIYSMNGPARWQFQHSIPAVKQLRYSITFRTLRDAIDLGAEPLAG
jgi:alkylated DNA repair dioxygenase AlkB